MNFESVAPWSQTHRGQIVPMCKFIDVNLLALYHTQVLPTLWKEAFGNIVGKEENAYNQHFISTVFSTLSLAEMISIFL